MEGSVLDLCVSGWGVNNYKYALHVSDALCEKDYEIQYCIRCQKYLD